MWGGSGQWRAERGRYGGGWGRRSAFARHDEGRHGRWAVGGGGVVGLGAGSGRRWPAPTREGLGVAMGQRTGGPDHAQRGLGRVGSLRTRGAGDGKIGVRRVRREGVGWRWGGRVGLCVVCEVQERFRPCLFVGAECWGGRSAPAALRREMRRGRGSVGTRAAHGGEHGGGGRRVRRNARFGVGVWCMGHRGDGGTGGG